MSATAAQLRAVLGELRPGDPELPEDHAGRSRPITLATLAAVRGPSYRRPGARLLVRKDGSTVDNLTGGCLDAGIVEVADEVERTRGDRKLKIKFCAMVMAFEGTVEMVVRRQINGRAEGPARSRCICPRRDGECPNADRERPPGAGPGRFRRCTRRAGCAGW